MHATRARSELVVGGLVPFSSIDYPGHLAAVVFCQGCPWRCSYCHNTHLLPACASTPMRWSDVEAFLKTRRGLLDAVVFSGGEPTVQAALPAAMRTVKAMGFLVGLHTAGIYVKRLAEVLPVVDWVGMDIKADFDDYERVTGVPGSGRAARSSAELIIRSGVAYQFRTTVDPCLLTASDTELIASKLSQMGARHHVLQACRT
ncbi:MAG TPA: anaerobic ribonucleoside-triphosphate reductase activating protein [Burkholderiales bacterium]|nr:anaerobic ribonucleoside-triphosphate reductase activating protein [Burkholderiales bacterium]